MTNQFTEKGFGFHKIRTTKSKERSSRSNGSKVKFHGQDKGHIMLPTWFSLGNGVPRSTQ